MSDEGIVGVEVAERVLRRARPGYSMGARVSVLEAVVDQLNRNFEKHVETSERLISKLDQRADRQDIILARLMAGVAVLVFLGQLAAPVILRALGVQAE